MKKRSEAKNKVAVATSLFPVTNELKSDFLMSLRAQSFQDFDLVVVNDTGRQLTEFHEEIEFFDLVELRPGDTPLENRQLMMEFLRGSNYEKVIFADCDDYFEHNRVELSVSLLNKYDIVVNDLHIVNDTELRKNYFNNRLCEGEELLHSDIIDGNVFGLSNTGIRLENLFDTSTKCLPIAFDWYFFSRLLLAGWRAIFTSKTATFYRQHDLNTVGMNARINDNGDFVNQVKKAHFEALSPYDVGYESLLQSLQMGGEKSNISNIKKNEVRFWWE